MVLGPDGGKVTIAEEAYAIASAFERKRPMFPDLVDGSDFHVQLKAFYEAVVRGPRR